MRIFLFQIVLRMERGENPLKPDSDSSTSVWVLLDHVFS